LYSNELIQTIF